MTLSSQHAVGHCQAPPPVIRWLAGEDGRTRWPAQNPKHSTTEKLKNEEYEFFRKMIVSYMH